MSAVKSSRVGFISSWFVLICRQWGRTGTARVIHPTQLRQAPLSGHICFSPRWKCEGNKSCARRGVGTYGWGRRDPGNLDLNLLKLLWESQVEAKAAFACTHKTVCFSLAYFMARVHCSNSLALHLAQRKPLNQFECDVDLSDLVQNSRTHSVMKGCAWFG